MADVKRWEKIGMPGYNSGDVMAEDADGTYVLHSDHIAALQRQRDEIEGLREALEACNPGPHIGNGEFKDGETGRVWVWNCGPTCSSCKRVAALCRPSDKEPEGWRPMDLKTGKTHEAPTGLPPEDVEVDIWKVGKYACRIPGVKLTWADADCDGDCGDAECPGHRYPCFVNDMGDDVLEGDDASHWRLAPPSPEKEGA